MAIQRKIFRYRGDVQGVGFRVNAIEQARGLKIAGYVRNEPNGDVTMDVQGTAEDVRELEKRVASSMEYRINELLVDVRDPLSDRKGFRIRY
ncbi:acylphosphatase [Rhodopirellula rubra]|uniref:acylphosphatase n=1 Tax=Aporhodopirellula rubra TaxID=980271 RepID=A0A7W5H6V7_9BACT|nr:acylphosphatase [Aporhodopirellula rubra]MBB3208972.1 acylphosphatase [Aporhodopirellula rubra]